MKREAEQFEVVTLAASEEKTEARCESVCLNCALGQPTASSIDGDDVMTTARRVTRSHVSSVGGVGKRRQGDDARATTPGRL